VAQVFAQWHPLGVAAYDLPPDWRAIQQNEGDGRDLSAWSVTGGHSMGRTDAWDDFCIALDRLQQGGG